MSRHFARGTAIAWTTSIVLSSLLLQRLWHRRRKTDPSELGFIPFELLSGDYAEELKLAVKCAIEAGNNMIPFLDAKGTAKEDITGKSLRISTKSCDSDFCTAIDIQNETLITAAIQQRFPQHKVIGEESTGTQAPELLTEQPTWIIDPIDGTTNFASGGPFTCVSIGFCNGGEPVLGVIYAPATHELYLAIKGRGAYRNGIPLKIHSDSEKRLDTSIVCFEFGYVRSTKGIDRMLEAVKRILHHGCRATRSYGSGALDLCYVATGRIDLVYTGIDEEGWKPWDYCAAVVVVNEVGCSICPLFDQTNTSGFTRGSFSIYSKSMICGVNIGLVNQCKSVLCNTL